MVDSNRPKAQSSVVSAKLGAPCPLCRSALPPRAGNSAFPFCSARCQLVDLSRWLDGDYKVAESQLLDDQDYIVLAYDPSEL